MADFFSITDLSVGYNSHLVLSNISFALAKGSIGCLLGPSGCGKTTLLRAIAGFEPVKKGSIVLDGNVLDGSLRSVAAEARNVGMVFQDNALFPHLSVIKNVSFGLHAKTKSEAYAIASEWLTKVGLSGKGNAMPHELSGGEQQRVALARALAPAPQLVLLDEPFSNLDADLRESLGQEVRSIFKANNVTALLVTHDQHEAFAIADLIGVINDGHLQQWGSAYEIYHQPNSRFVADFIGQGALIGGTMHSPQVVETALGLLPLNLNSCSGNTLKKGDLVDVLLRPNDVVHSDNSGQKARVMARFFKGAEFLYTLMLDNGEELLALVPSHHNHTIGEIIGIDLDLEHVVAFSKQ